jgi:hypothetical protein
MALGMKFDTSGTGRKFLPIVKFDAKAGDMMIVNREPQSDGTWEKSEIELKFPVHAVCDFANIEIGWIGFVENRFDYVMVKAGEKMPACPSSEHKQGIRLRMFFKDHGVREFSHTSKNVLRVIDAIHTQAESEATANPGKMPVVTFTGTETVKLQTKQGELRFKVPAMEISKWVDVPAEMKEAAAAEPVKTVSVAAKPVADLEDEF